MSKVIAFIPARCGSKSIAMKNIKPFCGKPLIYWNLEALQGCKGVDEVVVATDCDEIASVAASFGFSKVKVYRRKVENAQDHSSTESVMLEYIHHAQLSSEDLFMLVQATSPLTSGIHYTEGLELFHNQKADSLLTAVMSKRFFWTPEGTSLNYKYQRRPRRQDFSGQLLENGAFYISKVGSILSHENRLSGKIVVYEMPGHTMVELDEGVDWIIGEHLMRNYRIEPPKIKDIGSVKLLVSDVDGVLTDGSMYYTKHGDELKRFHTYDGMAFKLLRQKGIKTALITSEDTAIVTNRAKKMKIDHVYQGMENMGKLDAIKDICKKEGISLSQVIYVGDDINCKEALEAVGFAFCPMNAVLEIKALPQVIQLQQKGGDGVIRELYEVYIKPNLLH